MARLHEQFHIWCTHKCTRIYGYPKTAEIYVHDLGGETVGEVFEEDLEGDPVGESVRIDSLEDIEIPVVIDGGLGGNVC